jgi:hypothetical protein
MYKTIHPGMVNLAVDSARNICKKEDKKQGKPVNVYLTLGADGMTRSLYTGAIGALLWLQDYIPVVAENPRFEIPKQDIDTTLKVLRTICLPSSHDVIWDEETQSSTPSSSCRHYCSFLGSFVAWLTSGVRCVTNLKKPRTNMEMCRYLTGTALESFPSIPFTAYYIASIKTNNAMNLAEKLSRTVNFTKYMTQESISLNQPSFMVQTSNCPLVGCSGHPLGNTVLGQESNGSVEWFGLFQESEEFSKVCTKNGFSVADIKKYIYQTSYDEHLQKLQANEPISKFIHEQNFLKEVFDMSKKMYGLDTDTKDVEDLLDELEETK